MNDPKVSALIKEMIQSVEFALANGTKHYDMKGNLLTTPLEIITALTRDDHINLEFPAGQKQKV